MPVWCRPLLGLAAVLLASMALAQEPLEALERPRFDHYTLALTWHPGFCDSRTRPPRECRDPTLREGAEQGFVLHGLWPSLPPRFAERGVDRRRWWRKGCFLETSRPEGSFCRAHPPLDLPTALEDALDVAMPGRASCLDRYQYAKHGACLTFSEEAYFSASVALVERVNASAFAAFVILNQGGEVERNALIGAFESAFGQGTGRALRLECRGRGNRLLTEVRIGIAADRLAEFPAAGSLARQDRGRCATRVTIATFD